MTIPESPADITLDWLKEALPWAHSGCEPVSAEVESNFGGPSLLGKLARVRMTYASPECGPSSLIVKFQTCRSDWEAQIYRLLAQAQVRSVPRLFGAYENGTLIMEDLSPARSGSQAESFTGQQARDVLAMLAQIHGCFWGDLRVPALRPEQFAAAIEVNMQQCWASFERRYRTLLGDTAADFEWLGDNAMTVAAHRLSAPGTLFHGDVHAENLLFSGPQERPVLIDWQLAGRGLAANDVSFFLVKSLAVPERQASEARLLEAYWQLLPERARAEYSPDRFKLDYRACVTRSMLSAVMLVGPRFADRPGQLDLADVLAARVIMAVRDLQPVDAFRDLTFRIF